VVQNVAFLYLHGFASGPGSRKARYFQQALAARSIELTIPGLDEGDFSHLTVSLQLTLLENILQGRPVYLIGSSMGGYLASLYAARHPEVLRVVLLAPAFDFASRWEQQWPDAPNGGKVPEIEVFHYADQTTRTVGYGLIEDALRYPAFPDFSQPALIFHGRADDVVPILLARTFAASHPNARLVELNSDHELIDALPAIEASAIPFLLNDASKE
jgi:pimeloyl-ACP methyl ester carboxylesterase